MNTKHTTFTHVRNPSTAVEAALKTMPNRYAMTLVAAQQAKKISKTHPHRLDQALFDVANGVVNESILLEKKGGKK